jgi:hypothetical protein
MHKSGVRNQKIGIGYIGLQKNNVLIPVTHIYTANICFG